MDISIVNLQKKVSLNEKKIITLVRAILRHEKINKAALSFVFVTDARIKALNKKFLKRAYATDVLAFQGDCCSCDHHGLTGEIVISTDTAIENAGTYQTPLAQEITLYIIHGILHLIGYDDHKAADIKKMRRKEEELLKAAGNKVNKIC